MLATVCMPGCKPNTVAMVSSLIARQDSDSMMALRQKLSIVGWCLMLLSVSHGPFSSWCINLNRSWFFCDDAFHKLGRLHAS